MAEQSLAVKYRPKDFDSITEQEYIKIILENQIKNKDIQHAYLFTGPSGCGKTTIARIFGNKINNGIENIIEIDAASNNGVEQIRDIIDDAKLKPISSDFKIYVLDECHMLSIGAWNALLKLLEEPPKTTVFILCTTDPQKIPNTILSRVQRYDFQKISLNGIVKRLLYILCEEDNLRTEDNRITNTMDALEYIAKVAEGGMRTAISYLDKCLSYSNNITVENVIKALGVSDYGIFDNLLQHMLLFNAKESIIIIENIYHEGKDLKLFIKQFINFVLDIRKYVIYNNYNYIQIPNNINLDIYIKYNQDNILSILDRMIELSNMIKYEQNAKVLIESNILLWCSRSDRNEA